MFELDDLFLESADDDYDQDATLRTTEEGFVWCECEIDESNVIDGDPFEFITEAMYQNTVNANNISLAILADNYKYLRENGVELMTEASAKAKQSKGKIEAVKKFFRTAKEKVIAFFNSVLDKMKRLQAKFLMLFKKAQARAKSNYDQVLKDINVPQYVPKDVIVWASKQFNSLTTKGTSENFPGVGRERKVTFNTELQIIKGYGGYIKDINGLKKKFTDFMDKAEKKFTDTYEDPTEEELRTAPLTSVTAAQGSADHYSKIVNAGTLVAKNATNWIMSRVNISAKIINKAVFAKKEDKKGSVGESATYLDRVEMM